MSPTLIRLPFWLADRGFSLERVLARDPSRSWAESWSLLPAFELSGPERAFARELLTRKRNLWLLRCNQLASIGDFLVVDMSSPSPARRRSFLVELKSGAPLQLGGRGACGQMQNADLVVEELRRLALAESLTELVSGDGDAVLAWLGVGSR